MGLTVRQALAASSLAGSHVLAGERGLDRVIERLNVMEVPDILPWVKPRELLLTTAYPLRDTPEALAGLVAELDARGLAGLAIKVGRYIDAIPAEMIARAHALGFPLVRLPDHVAFDDILNQILTDILNRQAAALARAEQIHKALIQIVLSGGGLVEITTNLATLLGGPTLIVDGDGHLVTTSGLEDVDPRLLDDKGRLAHTDNGKPGVRLLSAPISAGGRQYGRIVAVEGARPLADGDLIALENAATVAALAITKAQAVAAVESKFSSDLLHDLLGGRVATAEDAVARGASLGWNLDRPLLVLVAQLSSASVSAPGDRRAQDRLVASITAAVRGRDREAAVVDASREVVVVTGAPSGDDPREAARRLAAAIRTQARATSRGPVSLGVSRVAPGAVGIAAAYEQASKALRIGRQVSGEGSSTHFDDLGVYRLLSLVDDLDELRAFADEALGPIAGKPDADEAEAAELRRTLRVLLDTNLNVAESARRLHFHYNTLRYRIAKLEGLVGPFTTDPELRVDLQVALRILDMEAV